MKNLAIKTQNSQGGQPLYKENLGFVTTFLNHSEDFISVDNFEGSGESYKKRELSEITIVQNGKVLFSGDKYQLFEKLKS